MDLYEKKTWKKTYEMRISKDTGPKRGPIKCNHDILIKLKRWHIQKWNV